MLFLLAPIFELIFRFTLWFRRLHCSTQASRCALSLLLSFPTLIRTPHFTTNQLNVTPHCTVVIGFHSNLHTHVHRPSDRKCLFHDCFINPMWPDLVHEGQHRSPLQVTQTTTTVVIPDGFGVRLNYTTLTVRTVAYF